MFAKRSLVIAAVLSVAMVLGLGGTASAVVLYQESFGTDVAAGGFAAQYPGFTSNLSNLQVASGVATWTGPNGGDAQIYRTMPSSYDWSAPLKISVDLASMNSAGGQSYGVFLSAASGGPSNTGVSFCLFWPSASNGGALADASFGNRYGGNRDVSPDVANDSTLHTLSLTIRQNADDSTKFDALANIDGTDQFGGWLTGISKSSYNINNSNPFQTFGLRSDGLNGAQYFDNWKLDLLVPESARYWALFSSSDSLVYGQPVFRG